MAERIVLVSMDTSRVIRNSHPPAPDYRDKYTNEYWDCKADDNDRCFACHEPIPEGQRCYVRGWYDESMFCTACVQVITLDEAIDAYEEGMDNEDE